MSNLKEYSLVRVVRLLGPHEDYNGWNINRRPPQPGDVGVILDLLSAPELPTKYVVECIDPADGSAIWLTDFFAEELEAVS